MLNPTGGAKQWTLDFPKRHRGKQGVRKTDVFLPGE